MKALTETHVNAVGRYPKRKLDSLEFSSPVKKLNPLSPSDTSVYLTPVNSSLADMSPFKHKDSLGLHIGHAAPCSESTLDDDKDEADDDDSFFSACDAYQDTDEHVYLLENDKENCVPCCVSDAESLMSLPSPVKAVSSRVQVEDFFR